MDHFFEILKVPSTASLEEIKRAYRERVKFWHPDRFPVESDRLQKLAHRQMQAINQAYRELKQHLAQPPRPSTNSGTRPGPEPSRAKPPTAPSDSARKGKTQDEPRPTLQFENGDCYIGPLAGSVPHGLGTYLFAGGNRYTGEFVNGKPHGRGTLWFINGDRYEGHFVRDHMEGDGVYLSVNGDRYVGGFKNGQPHGQGVHITASGKRYPGLWENGYLKE